jgi:hypothetical protein
LQCGLLRSNFSLAIFLCPLRQVFSSARILRRHSLLLNLERGTGFEPATITLEE